MKIILGIAILCVIMFSVGAYGQTPSELGVRLIPSKIMENTEGILEVYSTGDSTQSVDQLIATSSDSSIIQILGVEQTENHFITNVKIKAISEGTTNIALAAPGFQSQELPITVYKNSNTPANLLIKTTPTTFTTTGPKQGYVSVELTNNDGFPIKATDDTIITLTTTNNDVVQLKNDQLTIPKGEYFGIAEFQINHQGSAKISASSASMQTVSSTVTVSTTTQKQIVQVYVFPKKINAFQASYAYAIVQLHDSSGKPVIATDDIPVSIQVTNAVKTDSVNTSIQNSLIQANGQLVIKKGTYWSYVPVSVNAGVNGLFNVTISTKGYLVSQAANLTTVTQVCNPILHAPFVSCTDGTLLDDKSAKVDILPILTTGQNELVGVMHLEDSDNNPVIAKSSLSIPIDSSDPKTLSIDNTILDRGSQVGLVYGHATFSNNVTLNVVTQYPQSIIPVISSTSSDALSLVTDPLIPKILTQTNFPLSLYMTQNGAMTYFPKDLNPMISPKEAIQTESHTLSKGQSVVLLNSNLLKTGTASISTTTQDYSNNLSIAGFSSKPASIVLDYPDKILANLKNTFSVEVLDDQNLPIFLTKDVEFKIVSNNPNVLSVPESVIIKQGSYYSFFDVTAKNTGTSEISVLTSELPLAKFNIGVTSVTPDVTLTSNDYVNPNFELDATATAQYKNVPLNGMKVDWNVQGATIKNMDSTTDKDGKAKISVISQDPNKVTIQVTVSGGMFGTTSASKDIKVNPPLAPSTQNTDNSFSIMGVNPLFIIVPGVAAASGIILKKKNMLDGITEKMNLEERLSDMREKLSTSRDD